MVDKLNSTDGILFNDNFGTMEPIKKDSQLQRSPKWNVVNVDAFYH